MVTNNTAKQIANLTASYQSELIKLGVEPFITLQLTLGFQQALLSKAIESDAIPGWEIEVNHDKENHSGIDY